MKTAEQFFDAEKGKDNGDYDHLGRIPFIFRQKIFKLMDEYAMEVVKNYNSPAILKQALCWAGFSPCSCLCIKMGGC